LGSQSSQVWLFLIPIASFLWGISQGLRSLLIRRRQYLKVGIAAVVSIATGTVASVLCGLLLPQQWKSGGLVIGFVVQHLVFFLVLFKTLSLAVHMITRRKYRFMFAATLAYRKLIATMFISNSIALTYGRLPVFFIGSVFGTATLGLFGLAERISGAPIKLISRSIGTVYFQRASASWHNNGRYDQLFVPLFATVMAVGIPMYLFLIFFSAEILTFALGEKWQRIGELFSILMIGSLFGFITVPFDKGGRIRQKHYFIIAWQALRLALISASCVYCYYTSATIDVFLWMLIGVRILLYVISIICEYIWSCGLDVRTTIRKSLHSST
jgi:O-antigen/teichoic acid export membrane protein